MDGEQPKRLLSFMENHVGVTNKRVAVLGLAFKPRTGDVQNSRAIPIIEELQQHSDEIAAYDLIAAEDMREYFPDLKYAGTPKEPLDCAVGLVVTDWEEITELDEVVDPLFDRTVHLVISCVGLVEGD